MFSYLFQLGHQPHISIAEIRAVLSSNGLHFEEEKNLITYYKISTSTELPVEKIMLQLGGTIKILQLLKESENFEDDLFDYLNSIEETGKLNFSVSGPNASRLAIQVKKRLKELDKSVRYIEPKNTATILHNDLVETATDITLIQKSIFVTIAIQPIEDFTERDFGRPGSDSKSGMLPPKLARIMINLAEPEPNDVILDPFCGSGTILTEALSLGFANVIGSDNSPKAIDDSKKNVNWFVNKNFEINQESNIKIFQADVRQLDKEIQPESVNKIISEPYLGKPLTGKEAKSQLTTQAEELRQLYTDAFRVFYKILSPKGTIIFIVPKFKVGNDWIKIDCINNIKKLGFKLKPFSSEHESLVYSRPQQYVAREIWRFVK